MFGLFGDDIDDGGHAYPADTFGMHRYVTNIQTDMVEWDDFAYQQTYLQPRETPLRDNDPDCLAATGICPLHRRTQALNTFRRFYAPASDPDFIYEVKFCVRHEHSGVDAANCPY